MKVNITDCLPAGTILKGKTHLYKIEETLGYGGFGITYRALVNIKGNLGILSTNVCIKEFFMPGRNGRAGVYVTKADDSELDNKYRKMFTREALNLSRMHHPNIVRVLEFFGSNGTLYYSMEYIGGGSLDSYITRKKRLREGECAAIARQICGALQYMHSCGMLHLDLKPLNIMLRNGRAVLADIGFSGPGTPGYSPMEQSGYRDDGGLPVTMDIYALGATMFKMLTGHRPPEAADIPNYGFPTEELNSLGTSPWMVSLIKGCMQPEKTARPQTVTEVLGILEKNARCGVLSASSKTSDADRGSEPPAPIRPGMDVSEPHPHFPPAKSVVETGLADNSGKYGCYTKYTGDPEYGTFKVLKVPVTDPLPFPDGSIVINYYSNNRKGPGYHITLGVNIPGTVGITEDGIFVMSKTIPAGIPVAVEKYITNHGFLSKIHWEREETTSPSEPDFGTCVEVSFEYENCLNFNRKVERADKSWHRILLDEVEGLLGVLRHCGIMADTRETTGGTPERQHTIL